MGERGPQGPDEQTLLRVWEQRVLTGDTLAEIAEREQVSVPTIKRWISKGRELHEQLEYLDDTSKTLSRRAVREDAAAVMDMIRSWMVKYVDEGGDPVQAAVVVIKAEERKAKALGEAALLRLGPEQPADPAIPEGVQRAIEQYGRRA